MTIVRFIAVACVLAVAAPARAQSVEAEVLFRDGKKLIKDGKLAEGCDKIEASERIESSPGTLLNLGDCREKNNQLATAWAAFRKCAASAKTAGDAKREAEGRRRATALEPRLSYLTINVADSSRIEGLAIARNGTAVDPALWNQGVPVDTGVYEISGQAPGHERWSTRVQINAEGQKASVEVPRFKALGELSPKPEPTPPGEHTAPTKPVATPNEGEPPEQPERPAGPSMFTGTRKLAVAVGVVGVAGVVLGVVMGGKANNLEKQSDAICPTSTCDDPQALKFNSDAKSDATLANIGFIGGGAAIAGAAVLWFVGAPKIAHEDVAIVPFSNGLGLAGRF